MSAGSPDAEQIRRRLADQIANQLFTARLLGGPVRLVKTHRVRLALHPGLRDMLAEAPRIAAGGDPALVRVARIPGRTTPALIRLHGAAWSLILSGGRPVPAWLLAVHDAHPLPPGAVRPGWLAALDLRADRSAWPELARMGELIHAALPSGAPTSGPA